MGKILSEWSQPVITCNSTYSKVRMFLGSFKDIFEGESFLFNIRRSRNMDGAIVEFEKFKEGAEDDKVVTKYLNWNSKINESYEDIVSRFNLIEGDEMVFRYRILDRCGVYS